MNAVNSGLPGYEDIPCPYHSALLLAFNEEVARCLVRSGHFYHYYDYYPYHHYHHSRRGYKLCCM